MCLEESETNNQFTLVNTTIVHDEFEFTASALQDCVWLHWSDPMEAGMESECVLLRYSLTGYPASLSDGVLLYQGTDRRYCHTPLTSGQTCYYTIWVSHDGTNFFMPPVPENP